MSDMQVEFGPSWMAWIALRHFLPAAELHRLLKSMCADLGVAGFGELFEHTVQPEPIWADGLVVRAKKVDGEDAGGLQHAILSIIRENDVRPWFGSGPSAARLNRLAAAVTLGCVDLSTDADSFARLREVEGAQGDFSTLAEAIELAKDTTNEDGWQSVAAMLDTIGGPLQTVAIKHVADLLVDADRWDLARIGYERAKELLVRHREAVGGLARVWDNIIRQSEAATLAVTDGDSAARDVLPAAGGQPLADDIVRAANLSFDRRVLSAAIPPLRTTSAIRSPLLHASHKIGVAATLSIMREDKDADRRYWAVLRRLTALGSWAESRTARAMFGLHIADSAQRKDGVTAREGQLAAELLVDAGRGKLAKLAQWGPAVVGAIVRNGGVNALIARAAHFQGSRRSRSSVLVQLFQRWIPLCADQSLATYAVQMWRWLADTAAEFDATLDAANNLGGEALEALEELARVRPELRTQVADAVASAVEIGLRDERWRKNAAAAKVADAYCDAFADNALRQVIEATVDVLRDQDPAIGLWPLVRPCLEFVTSEACARLAGSNADLRGQIVAQVIRFGVEQESENSRLFFYLQRFDADVIGKAVRGQLDTAIKAASADAGRLNSSRVTESICALLLNPPLVGSKAASTALNSICMVLDTALSNNRSLGLTRLYDAFFLVASKKDVLGELVASFDEWSDRLFAAVVAVWHRASENPTVFAPFALPAPEGPSEVVVHNWTVASLRLGEVFDRSADIEAAIISAERNEQLGPSIRLGRATEKQGTGRRPGRNAILECKGDEFYRSLGRWLALLGQEEEDRKLWAALLDQVLRHGPRDEDAAVLLVAVQLGLWRAPTDTTITDYLTRLGQKPEQTEALLGPLARRLARGS